LDKRLNSFGIELENSLSFKARYSMLTRLPIEVGTSPVKEFAPRFKDSIVFKVIK
jgi:hypothetical protein